MRNLDHIISKVIQFQWDNSSVADLDNTTQLEQIYQAVGGVASHIAGDGSDLRVHIGKVLVTLINLSEQYGTSLETCLNLTYQDMRDNPPLKQTV